MTHQTAPASTTSQIGSSASSSADLPASAPNAAELRAFSLLYAIGYGVDSCTRNSWSDIWTAYGMVRDGLGLPREIPAGVVSRVAVTPRGGGHSDAPSYLTLCQDVFAWLAKNPSGHKVTDRIMRGALGARIAQLQADVDALTSPRRESSEQNPLVAAWQSELRGLRQEYGRITATEDYILINEQPVDVEFDRDERTPSVEVASPCVCGHDSFLCEGGDRPSIVCMNCDTAYPVLNGGR